MAWVVQNLGGERSGQRSTYANVWVVSNTALATGTVDLAALIGVTANLNQRWTLISLVADAAIAGTMRFNNASADCRRNVILELGENVRKGENSPYWFAKPGDGLSMITDQVLNDVQLIIGLL